MKQKGRYGSWYYVKFRLWYSHCLHTSDWCGNYHTRRRI